MKRFLGNVLFKGTCLVIGLVIGTMLGGCRNVDANGQIIRDVFFCEVDAEVTTRWVGVSDTTILDSGDWLVYLADEPARQAHTYRPGPRESCSTEEGSP